VQNSGAAVRGCLLISGRTVIDVELPPGPAAGALSRGFAACLASVAEVPVRELPLPDDDLSHALGAWRSWLAEHGSGLVPIADPVHFQWAGWWIAVVEDTGRAGEGAEVAVLAFGTPPGVVLSPQAPALLGRAPADLRIREAYAVASLDPVLHRQAAAPDLRGTVEGLAVAPAAEAPMQLLEVVRARAGRGLEGDRYAAGAGTFSSRAGRRPGYDLTLIAAEALDELSAAGQVLDFADTRRNVLTRGIDCPGRAALAHRGRAVRGAPVVRALRPPRPAQRTWGPAAAHPPRRAACRRPHRRGDPPGSAGPLRLIGRRGGVHGTPSGPRRARRCGTPPRGR
jgi:hypothetical protein